MIFQNIYGVIKIGARFKLTRLRYSIRDVAFPHNFWGTKTKNNAKKILYTTLQQI